MSAVRSTEQVLPAQNSRQLDNNDGVISPTSATIASATDAPTVCIVLPNKEASEADQNNANTRYSEGASVALRHRSSGDRASCY